MKKYYAQGLIIVCLTILSAFDVWVEVGESSGDIGEFIAGFGSLLIVAMLMIYTTFSKKIPPPPLGKRPTHPLLTYVGLNNRQLVFQISGLLALAFIFFDLPIISLIVLAALIVYYILIRDQILADYRAMQIGGVQLDPASTYEFSRGASFTLLGIAILFFIGMILYFSL